MNTVVDGRGKPTMQDDPRVGDRVLDGESEARLQLTANRPASEHIDGAWWPRSSRLAEELPGLVTSLSNRLAQVVMVGYWRNGWTDAPPLVEIAGHTVELLGFTCDEPASVILIGEDGRHITLRVIPPDASELVARQALDAVHEGADSGVAGHSRSAVARSLAEVADKLARHEERHDDQRTAEIVRWCEEAAQQFVDAPVQTFVPILVEHIVRNRMIESRAATMAPSVAESGAAGAPTARRQPVMSCEAPQRRTS